MNDGQHMNETITRMSVSVQSVKGSLPPDKKWWQRLCWLRTIAPIAYSPLFTTSSTIGSTSSGSQRLKKAGSWKIHHCYIAKHE
jgi:hypothetical protein